MSLKDIALSYLHTPHMNGTAMKGAGVDCCTLIMLILQEAGYGTIPITFGYSQDWFIKKDCEELILPYLIRYFDLIDDGSIKDGDILSYRWGRSEYAHLSMVIDAERQLVIHCDADAGVEITEMSDTKFKDKANQSRLTGVWRLKK